MFAAAMSFAAAACSQNEPEQPVVANGEGTITITASLPAAKSYDSDGKVTWEAGDVIAIATNKQAITTDGEGGPTYAAVVTLTAENIISPTKASFTVSGDAFDGATDIYAVAVSGFPSWDGVVYGLATNGTLTTTKVTQTFLGQRPHMAYAKCTPADPQLNFSNVGCVIKWNTNTSKTVQHVSFFDNDGSKVGMSFRYAADGTVTPNPNATYDSRSVQSYAVSTAGGSVSDAGAGPYYMFLASGNTYANGVTLAAYGSWKDDSSGIPDGAIGKIVINDSFSTVPGRMYDFGTIEDHYYYATYKEAYDAGQTIKVGDLEVNKATFGASQLITSDARFYPASGVAFVDPSATGANLQYWSGDKCIVIGNDPSQRSNLEIRSVGNFGDGCTVAFKNLKIKHKDDFTGTWMSKTNKDETLNWFAIDNCEVWFYTRLVELYESKLNNFSITNSDIVVRNDCGPTYDLHRSLICRGPETAYTGEKLIFRNNLVTTEGTDVKSFGLINNGSTKLTVNTVDISQNTIHNIQNASFYFVCLSNIGTSITMTKNLLWKGGNFNWIQLYGLADGASAAFAYSGVTDNKLEGWILRAANGDAIVATGTAGYYSAASAYPFAQGDNATVISTRDYTPIAALSGYGVSNPKRLQ